jgi:hypothetical protein
MSYLCLSCVELSKERRRRGCPFFGPSPQGCEFSKGNPRPANIPLHPCGADDDGAGIPAGIEHLNKEKKKRRMKKRRRRATGLGRRRIWKKKKKKKNRRGGP